jgi:hypothetical protein
MHRRRLANIKFGRHLGHTKDPNQAEPEEADQLERDGDHVPDPAGSYGACVNGLRRYAGDSARKGHGIIMRDRGNSSRCKIIYSPRASAAVCMLGESRHISTGDRLD